MLHWTVYASIVGTLSFLMAATLGVLAIMKWRRDERDRKRTREENLHKQFNDSRFDEFCAAYVQALRAGPKFMLPVPPHYHAFAARAVAEGCLAWGPAGLGVVLPGSMPSV
jgi:hypothetical protein